MPAGATLLRFDRSHASANGLVGVDEAGRGAFAGPVTAAAVYLPASVLDDQAFAQAAEGINDSKQLRPAQREHFAGVIRGWSAAFGVRAAIAEASVAEVETHNVIGATARAMTRALEALGLALPQAMPGPLFAADSREADAPAVLIDGRPMTRVAFCHHGTVGGDAKSLAIASASILAKVSRDATMSRLGTAFPHYHWADNKGYGGCRRHRQAILDHGACEHHRSAYLRNLLASGANRD